MNFCLVAKLLTDEIFTEEVKNLQLAVSLDFQYSFLDI